MEKKALSPKKKYSTIALAIVLIISLAMFLFNHTREDKKAEEQVKLTIRNALQTELDARRYSNKDKGQEFKQKLSNYLSAKSGELGKMKGEIDFYNKIDPPQAEVNNGIYRLDFNSISIKNNKAMVDVDEYSWMVTGRPPNPAYKNNNGLNHKMVLELEHGRWLIESDESTFIHGYEP